MGTWLLMLGLEIAQHGQIKTVFSQVKQSARILMNRNSMVEDAKKLDDVKMMLMVDPDMRPDLYKGQKDNQYPFLSSSLQYMEQRRKNGQGPCVIAAPAFGPRPDLKCNVWPYNFDPETNEIEDPKQISIEHVHRRLEEPILEHVACIGTGLILIPMEVFDMMEPPYFDDIYRDVSKTHLKYSQDIFFTGIKCPEANVPVFCNWHSFCGHNKEECIEVPDLPPGAEMAPPVVFPPGTVMETSGTGPRRPAPENSEPSLV